MNHIFLITMKEAQRYEIIQKLISKKITQKEASKMLDLKSTRQIRRLQKKVIENGLKGLAHKNRGREGPNRIKPDVKKKILEIYKEKYYDFKPTLAVEKLSEIHNITISKETMRNMLTNEGFWKPKLRKKPKIRHVWRERRGNYGELQQFDGSYHKWFEDRSEKCCLLLSVE